MPALYIVATPIGNLEDITLRALRVLREVKLIAAEDTRKTQRLLNKYEIKTPMTSYYEHNKMNKLEYILGKLLAEDVALVSEAGMPGLSDPGYELIRAAHARGITTIPVPGPSAIVTALAVSGLPTDQFHYLGFLPGKSSARKRLLESVTGEAVTIIALEAPHRLQDTLKDMLAVLGDRQMAVCRELTKLHEEVFRGTINEASQHFVSPRGEFTLVIAGSQKEKPEGLTGDTERQLQHMYLSGLPAKEAIARAAAQTGLSRKELYRAWVRLAKTWDLEQDCVRLERS